MNKNELYEVMDAVWDNYFTLTTTAVEAMAIIWHDYANGTLFESLNQDHGITDAEFWEILVSLTVHVRDIPNRRMPAMEFYKEWESRKV